MPDTPARFIVVVCSAAAAITALFLRDGALFPDERSLPTRMHRLIGRRALNVAKPIAHTHPTLYYLQENETFFRTKLSPYLENKKAYVPKHS